MPDPCWPEAVVQQVPFPRGDGRVLVLSFKTAVEPKAADRMLALLDPGEQERWNRFQSAKAKDEFLAGRSLLRWVLGHATGSRPERLAFHYNAKGRPELAGGGLAFNLSHSHGLGLLAVTESGRIGVDLERVRPVSDLLGLARRYFTPGEVGDIEAAEISCRLDVFYQLWTRKEAFIKAHGEGVAYGLDRVQVTSGVDVPPRFLGLAEGDDPAAWSLSHLDPAPGFQGALAVDSSAAEVTCLHCPAWVV
jgi:4'-phosphopantetheinyl transferase